MYSYKTKGTCSREIQFDVENNIVKEIRFISTLKGIDCGGRGTSCPDQLALALLAYKQQQA